MKPAEVRSPLFPDAGSLRCNHCRFTIWIAPVFDSIVEGCAFFIYGNHARLGFLANHCFNGLTPEPPAVLLRILHYKNPGQPFLFEWSNGSRTAPGSTRPITSQFGTSVDRDPVTIPPAVRPESRMDWRLVSIDLIGGFHLHSVFFLQL